MAEAVRPHNHRPAVADSLVEGTAADLVVPVVACYTPAVLPEVHHNLPADTVLVVVLGRSLLVARRTGLVEEVGRHIHLVVVAYLRFQPYYASRPWYHSLDRWHRGLA